MSQLSPPPSPDIRPKGAPLISAEGLRKSFRMGDSDVHVLRGVDLAVQPGEFLAIEGRSGSGKSTLLHILAGLDDAQAGQVWFAGTDLMDLARRAASAKRGLGATLSRIPLLGNLAWAAQAVLHLTVNSGPDRRLARIRNEHFGFVFQFYHLLPELNVLENTMLAPMISTGTAAWAGARAATRARAAEVLEQMGLSHRLTHRPAQLSGGERQRVAIARALMARPKVIFADEPTGNLDAETGRQIMNVLEKLHRDHAQTIVMVTHDRSLAKEADRALILREGRLSQG